MTNETKPYLMGSSVINIFISVFMGLINISGRYAYDLLLPSTNYLPEAETAIISFVLMAIFILLLIIRAISKIIFKKTFSPIAIISITAITIALFNFSFSLATTIFHLDETVGIMITDHTWYIIFPIIYYACLQTSGFIFSKKLTRWFISIFAVPFLLSVLTSEYFGYSNTLINYTSAISIGLLGMIFTPNLAKYLEHWFPELLPMYSKNIRVL